MSVLEKANELQREDQMEKKKLERKAFEYQRQIDNLDTEVSTMMKENDRLREDYGKISEREKELLTTISTLQQENSSLLEKSHAQLTSQNKLQSHIFNNNNSPIRLTNQTKESSILGGGSRMQSTSKRGTTGRHLGGSKHMSEIGEERANLSFLLEQSFDQLMDDYTQCDNYLMKE